METDAEFLADASSTAVDPCVALVTARPRGGRGVAVAVGPRVRCRTWALNTMVVGILDGHKAFTTRAVAAVWICKLQSSTVTNNLVNS